MKPEILSGKRCIIGEGPIWCEKERVLYQVNGYGPNEILRINLETKERSERPLDAPFAAIALTKDGELIISSFDGAFILNDDNTRTYLYDKNKYNIKYANDAKVGPDGNLYLGTQSTLKAEGEGAIDGKLYSISKQGEVKVLLDGLLLSNGFDWSMDEKRLYHTDSATEIIKEYEFNKESGDLTYTGREIKVAGVDGITIDERDFLYVGCWGKGHIAVVDTAKMEIIDYIPVPTSIPASCCFAGDDMRKLVVVTALFDMDPEKNEGAGYTYIYNTDTCGRAPYLFG